MATMTEESYHMMGGSVGSGCFNFLPESFYAVKDQVKPLAGKKTMVSFAFLIFAISFGGFAALMYFYRFVDLVPESHVVPEPTMYRVQGYSCEMLASVEARTITASFDSDVKYQTSTGPQTSTLNVEITFPEKFYSTFNACTNDPITNSFCFLMLKEINTPPSGTFSSNDGIILWPQVWRELFTGHGTGPASGVTDESPAVGQWCDQNRDYLRELKCEAYAIHPPYSCTLESPRGWLEATSLSFGFAELGFIAMLFMVTRILWCIHTKHGEDSSTKATVGDSPGVMITTPLSTIEVGADEKEKALDAKLAAQKIALQNAFAEQMREQIQTLTASFDAKLEHAQTTTAKNVEATV